MLKVYLWGFCKYQVINLPLSLPSFLHLHFLPPLLHYPHHLPPLLYIPLLPLNSKMRIRCWKYRYILKKIRQIRFVLLCWSLQILQESRAFYSWILELFPNEDSHKLYWCRSPNIRIESMLPLYESYSSTSVSL